VCVEHAQLLQYTQQEVYNIPTASKYLHSTNVTFDIIVLEVYLPLVNNKTVCIVPNLLCDFIPKDIGFLQGPSSLLETTPFIPSPGAKLTVSQVESIQLNPSMP
jgi:hypothetical protein